MGDTTHSKRTPQIIHKYKKITIVAIVILNLFQDDKTYSIFKKIVMAAIVILNSFQDDKTYLNFKKIVIPDLVRNRVSEIMTNISKLFRILRHRFIDPVAACAAMTIFLYLGI